MQSARALIREHRRLAVALVLLAFCIKAVIPAGFIMSAPKDIVLTVSICAYSTGNLKQMKMLLPVEAEGQSQSEAAEKGEQCALSGLAKVALAGTPVVQLALAFGFILVLGLVATEPLPLRLLSYLRPPLRGPPTAA